MNKVTSWWTKLLTDEQSCWLMNKVTSWWTNSQRSMCLDGGWMGNVQLTIWVCSWIQCGILPLLQFWTDVWAFNNILVQAQFLTESPNSFDGLFFYGLSILHSIAFINFCWWCDDQWDLVLITMADRPPRKISYHTEVYLILKFRCNRLLDGKQRERNITTQIFQFRFKRGYWCRNTHTTRSGILSPSNPFLQSATLRFQPYNMHEGYSQVSQWNRITHIWL